MLLNGKLYRRNCKHFNRSYNASECIYHNCEEYKHIRVGIQRNRPLGSPYLSRYCRSSCRNSAIIRYHVKVILGLFAFLLGISIVLIIIGLFRPNETGFALIGFGLMFILSIIVLNGNLEIETGADINTTLIYSINGQVNSSVQSVSYSHEYFDNSTSKQVGFWLAILSAVGFIGMLFSIRGLGKKDE